MSLGSCLRDTTLWKGRGGHLIQDQPNPGCCSQCDRDVVSSRRIARSHCSRTQFRWALKKHGVRAKRAVGVRISGSNGGEERNPACHRRAVDVDWRAHRASPCVFGARARRHVAIPTRISVRMRTRLYAALVKANSHPPSGARVDAVCVSPQWSCPTRTLLPPACVSPD